eukprot:4218922-Karenia_brevis.AAC.1
MATTEIEVQLYEAATLITWEDDPHRVGIKEHAGFQEILSCRTIGLTRIVQERIADLRFKKAIEQRSLARVTREYRKE